jgi:hypothetical protein
VGIRLQVVIQGTIRTEGHTEFFRVPDHRRPEEEVPLHCSALPKFSFPKFSGNQAAGGHTGNHQNGGPHIVLQGAPDHRRPEEEVPLHCSALTKFSFPKFSGTNPKIWIDKCVDYIKIFNIPDHMWTTAASLHMEDNAAKWLQVYKMKQGLDCWQEFVSAAEEKFGADDYRKSIQELLSLKQEGSVEEYTQEFQAVQYQICMFNAGLDEMFFTSHYINGFVRGDGLLYNWMNVLLHIGYII